MKTHHAAFYSLLLFLLTFSPLHAADKIASHPPLRPAPPAINTPLPKDHVYFVDAAKGNERNDGSQAKPWKSVQAALQQLRPGDTLALRAGTYYERVYVALMGTAEKPIVIRAAPGERVVIDGGWSEFTESPGTAWEPYSEGSKGEFRSVRPYRNQRTVVGSFGDSMIGLQTYYHHQDLAATSELVDWINWDKTDESDLKPLYLGPGVWHNSETGHIHARLAHTHIPEISNYQGETDPRKLPLVIAPFDSVPLTVDGADYVRFEGLEFRGAGYTAVVLDHAAHTTFDNCTIWCGTYGIRATGTTFLHLKGSRFYGSLAPWSSRADASKRDYPGRPHRNLSRLNTHALIELGQGFESSVYYTPMNDDWHIEQCHFADAHDGLYLGAINVDFHHNLIENLQDDGLYLSPMYRKHKFDGRTPQIRVYQNEFRHLLTAIAFGGNESMTDDELYIYRNLFDFRWPVFTSRPSTRKSESTFYYGKLIGDHGSPPWPTISFYHNTVISKEACRDVMMASSAGGRAGYPRHVYNNIFYHLAKLPGFMPPTDPTNSIEDGNIYWSPQVDDKAAQALFARFRSSPAFAASKTVYPAGSTTHSLVVAPFTDVDQPTLKPDSPAVNAGVEIPANWPNVLQKQDQGKPDIGALPLGVERTVIGRRE